MVRVVWAVMPGMAVRVVWAVMVVLVGLGISPRWPALTAVTVVMAGTAVMVVLAGLRALLVRAVWVGMAPRPRPVQPVTKATVVREVSVAPAATAQTERPATTGYWASVLSLLGRAVMPALAAWVVPAATASTPGAAAWAVQAAPVVGAAQAPTRCSALVG